MSLKKENNYSSYSFLELYNTIFPFSIKKKRYFLFNIPLYKGQAIYGWKLAKYKHK